MVKAKSTTKKSAKRSTKSSSARSGTNKGLSPEEIAAMKETLKERKAQTTRAEGEKALLDKIAEMPAHDRDMAKRIHAIISTTAPSLSPKTWYGMPAYADQDGKAVCFFQSADKFKARYATFGFNDNAKLDEGSMWATSFALDHLTADDEAKIAALVKKAVG